ncbi:MAG TPA: hypothetical protein DIW47_05330 [Bacteroidetes bacterium]|nr:hypothetical protein [Bacteroidota bacterium]
MLRASIVQLVHLKRSFPTIIRVLFLLVQKKNQKKDTTQTNFGLFCAQARRHSGRKAQNSLFAWTAVAHDLAKKIID